MARTPVEWEGSVSKKRPFIRSSETTPEINLPIAYTIKRMRKPNEYLVIRVWGEMMHTAPSYIVADQEQAAATNAPLDSIYFVNKQWVRLGEITNPDVRRRIDERLIELRKNSKA